MKILIVAQFWRGAKDWSYKEALEQMGHDVRTFDIYSFFVNKSGRRSSLRSKIADRLLWPLHCWRMNRALLRQAVDLDPELVLTIKAKEIFPSTLRKIKALNTGILFNISTDDIYSPRYPTNTSRLLQRDVPFYHCIFTNKPWAIRREMIERGAQRVEYLQFAFEPEINKPVKLTPEEAVVYASDVVFIGSPEKERIAVLEDIAKRGWNLKIYGPDWHRFSVSPELQRCIVGRPVYFEEHAKVLSAAKIALVFFRRGDRDLTNTRLFETPASGVFSLVEENLEVSRFYEGGKEVETFKDAVEACGKIEYYLAHEKERKTIAAAGYKKAVSFQYTFMSRAKKILDVFHSMWMTDSMAR